jgi:hypothetical protein
VISSATSGHSPKLTMSQDVVASFVCTADGAARHPGDALGDVSQKRDNY